MKNWATNKMRKYKEVDKNNKGEIKMCHDKLISTNVNCDAAKKGGLIIHFFVNLDSAKNSLFYL